MNLKRQSKGHNGSISSNGSHGEGGKLKYIGLCNRITIQLMVGSIYLNKNTIRVHKMLNMRKTMQKKN